MFKECARLFKFLTYFYSWKKFQTLWIWCVLSLNKHRPQIRYWQQLRLKEFEFGRILRLHTFWYQAWRNDFSCKWHFLKTLMKLFLFGIFCFCFFTSTTKVSADVKSAANSNLVKYKQEKTKVEASRSEFES